MALPHVSGAASEAGWPPPPRPDWVAAINAGAVPLLAAEAELPFERDALLGEALAAQGLDARDAAAFGAPGFDAEPALEGLARAATAIEEEARLHVLGRVLARRFLLRLLVGRLQLMRFVRDDPGVRDEELASPLVVAGAPRTGTTALYAMLAADPAHRAPLGWELLHPVPPPPADASLRAADPRIAIADRELTAPQTVVSGLRAIHAYGARRPKECLSAMSFSLLSEEITARFFVPSYAAWLEACDPAPAYDVHRLVLQVLQRRTGPAAWVLKSPVHLHALPALLRAHPGARVVVTHRDPVAMLASLASLIATLRYAHSDEVDLARVAAEHARRFGASLARLVAWDDAGALPAARVRHVRHAELARRGVGVVEDVYAWAGRPLSDAVRARMAAVAARGGDEGAGGHAYSIAATGLDAAALRRDLAAYRARFEVPDEAVGTA